MPLRQKISPRSVAAAALLSCLAASPVIAQAGVRRRETLRPLTAVGSIDQSAKGEKYYFQCFGRSCDGLNLQINVANSDQIEFTLVGATPGLPPGAKPLVDARPQFARPQYTPDETVTISRVWL